LPEKLRINYEKIKKGKGMDVRRRKSQSYLREEVERR